MAKQIKLTRTMTKTYTPVTEYYPEGYTIEKMAEMDATTDDPEMLFETLDSDKVEWEIINDEEPTSGNEKREELDSDDKRLKAIMQILSDETVSREIKVSLILEMVYHGEISLAKGRELCTETGIFSEHWMVIDAQATDLFSKVYR